MTLDESKKGSRIEILEIRDRESRDQLMRFGITEGSEVVCAEKLPMGPVIVRKKRQEIAVGRKLAQNIVVAKACCATK
ncbi:MAG TPA: ferrous iron transport protein A [Armatimonadota bacterium]|jgi:ferrous iron transport protein A